MPEVRLSDYVQQFANTLGRMGNVFGGISRDLNERARVAAVNDNLAYFEESFGNYIDNAPKGKYEEYLEDSEITAAVPKSFGEAQFSTVANDYAQFVDAQAEYIKNNVTHKQARQELLWHLQQKAVQERRNLLRVWDQAADAHFKTGLAKLYDATMKADIPWEEKVARITNRVVEGVRAGRLSEDQGQIIVQEATDAAQYTYAKGGALEAIRLANDLDAGEAWVRENTPFYDGNPDAREELIGDVRREWDAIARREDMELDRIYADLHINAETIEQVDTALAKLEMTDYHDGDKKYTWQIRFEARKQKIEALFALPGDPADNAKWIAEAQDVFADKYRAQLIIDINNGVPIQFLRTRLEQEWYGYITDPETGEPTEITRINSKHFKEFDTMIDTALDERLKPGISYIDEKLDGDQEYAAINALRKVYQSAQTMTLDELYKAAKNIVDPVKQQNLENSFKRTQEMIWRGRNISPLEQLLMDISEDKYLGLTGLRSDTLDTACAMLVDYAEEIYPERRLYNATPDVENLYGLGHGHPIMIDPGNILYTFLVEDNQPKLYRYTEEKDTGRWFWKPVITEAERAAIEAAETREKELAAAAARAPAVLSAPPSETTRAEKAESISAIVNVMPELAVLGAFGRQIQKTAEQYAEVEAGAEERRKRLTADYGYDLSKYEETRPGSGHWRAKGGGFVLDKEKSAALSDLKLLLPYKPEDFIETSPGVYIRADGTAMDARELDSITEILNRLKEKGIFR